MPNPDFDEDVQVEKYDPATSVLPCVNISSEPVRLIIGGRRLVWKPGEVKEVEGVYALPRQFQKGRDALPAVVELESGKPPRVVWLGDKRARSFLLKWEKENGPLIHPLTGKPVIEPKPEKAKSE